MHQSTRICRVVRLQSISGCIFIQLNQIPPWPDRLVVSIDGECEIYAVLCAVRSDAFHAIVLPNCVGFYPVSVLGFGLTGAVKRGYNSRF